MSLIKSKIAQAVEILKELDVDLWLTLCRESSLVPDPVTELIVGKDIMWLSVFFITKNGETAALVGSADAANYAQRELYQNVIVYRDDVGEEVLKIIKRINPNKIAINYSKSDYTADGLSSGLYLQLQDWLHGTDNADRLISAESIISKLRGRKNSFEIEALKKAATIANSCWNESIEKIKIGMSEIEIALILDESIHKMGCTPSFNTIVNAGAKSQPGHGLPSTAILEKGDLLHIDFGIRYNSYCSDLQRLAYFRKDNEKAPPQQLQKAFNKVKSIIDYTSTLYKPGALGYEIDAEARKMLLEDGFPEYDHGLGHQLGRSIHDGAASVAPLWKRYGTLSKIPLEEGNCFTIELGIEVHEIGYVGLEEDLIVTPSGGSFLCPRQITLLVK